MGGILSHYETSVQLCELENVSQASSDIIVRRKWLKPKFWVNFIIVNTFEWRRQIKRVLGKKWSESENGNESDRNSRVGNSTEDGRGKQTGRKIAPNGIREL